MQFLETNIAGPVEIVPVRHGDPRGYFSEIFRCDLFEAKIGKSNFIQENQSLSAKIGTLRGLHFQSRPFVQGKLVRCLSGAILDVAVDLRHGSPGFGKWTGVELSAEKGNQLWVPGGFAHGFCTLAPDTLVAYKVTSYYSAEHDLGVAWDDPAIGIAWPDCADPETLSTKDRAQPCLATIGHYFEAGY